MTDEHLEQFKERMRIFGIADDDNLMRMLEVSESDIKNIVGDFEIDEFAQGKELIFERTRYAYNDQLEYFYDNFQQRILDVSFVLAGDDDGNS